MPAAIPIIAAVGTGVGIASARGQTRKQDAAQDTQDEIAETRARLKTEEFQARRPGAEQDLREQLASSGIQGGTQAKYLKKLQREAFGRESIGLGLNYDQIRANTASRDANQPDWVGQLASSVGNAGTNAMMQYYSQPQTQISTTPSPLTDPILSLSKPLPTYEGYSYGTDYSQYTIGQ